MAFGGIVALGKFDALHIGHRELAIQASKAGTPFLLSFVGMAEVFGWEPRPPIVAKCDRKRVLNTWAPYCGNVAPAEFSVEFSSVRHLTPRQFVEKLSKELGVCGVVAGENYRFGYKAAGDTSELVRLCEEYGIVANIVSSVMDKTQLPVVTSSTNSKEKGQVSSTRVRHALAEGDMKYVSELLGRKHRLKLILPEQEGLISKGSNRISVPKSCLLNLSPKDGSYGNCSFLVDYNTQLPCKTVIDSTHIHIESDQKTSWADVLSQGCRVISIEFDTSEGVF
ncbi:FAD synthetase [Macleaya cordata]|uniref:FAD synthase n=1 Tax=Macleaya cordata TaxID=56857 RepID=A0A200PV07_MACCD|nr:FAD synthetase [Macleaya cordata]